MGRKYALERIFVPLAFKRYEEQDEKAAHEILEAFREPDTAEEGQLAAHGKAKADIPLEELIPASGYVWRFILSDPGEGKTTLLKRIASVYSQGEDCGVVINYIAGRLEQAANRSNPSGQLKHENCAG